jgi:hypothetical protein|tara:strand:+ start:638 stop:1060 length:423 start_codon:yes stop_codon:yes gene_type:complete
MGFRNFGSGHGAWSTYKSQHGLGIAQSPEVVSGYILERKLIKELKEKLTVQELRKIAKKYALKKYYYGKGQKKILDRLDRIISKVMSMNVAKLQETFEILDTKGVIECLIHINRNKPLLTKRYINTNMNQLTFDDYEGED